MAAAGGDGGAGPAAEPAAEEPGAGGGGPAPAERPGRAQVFATVVDTFLEKLVAAGSYQRFVNCYRCFYKLQPQLTKSIYDQFISQLQTSIKEEIQEVKNEGNLEGLFSSLDKIVEEAKDREEPAWRPSGVPEQDVRSAMVPYLLKHRSHLRRVLRDREQEHRKVAESVLLGRDRIAELQQLIQARQQAWQEISKEHQELIMTFQEPQ
ncbi:polyamine-modulated factor 1 [Oenanthe melanoleuca]|uniref:polyamine-modulated factor 1 n=1 Tax=Oenanthe melanoleuca TaxID=2939378 RepID=UPI0024C129BD|nr:polyamine-modulated factor 1 [Oenanthe melanoleuca]